MARYFFHLAAGEVVLPDSKGRECNCLEDAFFHARRIAHETGPYLNDEDGHWTIRVRTPDYPLKLDVLIPVRRPQKWLPRLTNRGKLLANPVKSAIRTSEARANYPVRNGYSHSDRNP